MVQRLGLHSNADEIELTTATRWSKYYVCSREENNKAAYDGKGVLSFWPMIESECKGSRVWKELIPKFGSCNFALHEVIRELTTMWLSSWWTETLGVLGRKTSSDRSFTYIACESAVQYRRNMVTIEKYHRPCWSSDPQERYLPLETSPHVGKRLALNPLHTFYVYIAQRQENSVVRTVWVFGRKQTWPNIAARFL